MHLPGERGKFHGADFGAFHAVTPFRNPIYYWSN